MKPTYYNNVVYPVSGTIGPTPAPGSNWSYDIPDNMIMEIYAVKIKLTTDANVANRYANFRYTDSTPYIHIMSAFSDAITASQVVTIIAAAWPAQVTDLTNHVVHLPFPFPLRVPTGKTLGFVISNIQAGDAIEETIITCAKLPFNMA